MDNSSSQSNSRVPFQNIPPTLRRPRADTMPSQSSAFPYATEVFPHSNVVNPAMSESADNLSTFSIAARHRSGSFTLPTNGGYDNSSNASLSQASFNPPMYHAYDPSSPIDENASSTIASTLASLGLDDETTAPYTENTHQTVMRGRSLTVSGQMIGNEMPHHLHQQLAFHPFSPQTQSSVLNRPRAISLGMADSFSPFDLKNTAATTTTSTPSSLPPPARLRMQPIPNESPLRASNSMSDDLAYTVDDDQVDKYNSRN